MILLPELSLPLVQSWERAERSFTHMFCILLLKCYFHGGSEQIYQSKVEKRAPSTADVTTLTATVVVIVLRRSSAVDSDCLQDIRLTFYPR